MPRHKTLSLPLFLSLGLLVVACALFSPMAINEAMAQEVGQPCAPGCDAGLICDVSLGPPGFCAGDPGPGPGPAGTVTPMGTVLCTVVSWIYGNLGRGLATLAIIILGVGAMLGKTSWGLALTVGVGISIIFNAATIVELLGMGVTGC